MDRVRPVSSLIERPYLAFSSWLRGDLASEKSQLGAREICASAQTDLCSLCERKGTFVVRGQHAVYDQIFADDRWVIGGPGGAAVRLGLNRTTLIATMKKLGISSLILQPEVDVQERENEIQERSHARELKRRSEANKNENILG